MFPTLRTRMTRWTAKLESASPASFVTLATILALTASVFFFSPKLQLWTFDIEGTFETTRARTYLQQCAAPLRRDVEPAMQWRLLPPAVCHAVGARGWVALALPWAGVVALLAACARLLRQEGLTATQALLGLLMVGTTSAIVVPVGWLGMNDAWIWLALVAVAFVRARWLVVAACLLGPWIDERFVIGLPLACAVRGIRNDPAHAFSPGAAARELARVAPWLVPYVAARLLARRFGFSDDTGNFLQSHLRGFVVWLPWAPLGWWMALRLGWFAVGAAAWDAGGRRPGGVAGFGAVVVGTCAVMLVLAADISRSAAIVLPAVLLGLVTVVRRHGASATRWLAWLAGLNLALPAAHVVYTKVDVISPLPIELARLLRRIFFAST